MGSSLKGLIWSFLVESLWCQLPPFPFSPLYGVWSTQPHSGTLLHQSPKPWTWDS